MIYFPKRNFIMQFPNPAGKNSAVGPPEFEKGSNSVFLLHLDNNY